MKCCACGKGSALSVHDDEHPRSFAVLTPSSLVICMYCLLRIVQTVAPAYLSEVGKSKVEFRGTPGY